MFADLMRQCWAQEPKVRLLSSVTGNITLLVIYNLSDLVMLSLVCFICIILMQERLTFKQILDVLGRMLENGMDPNMSIHVFS